MTQGTNTDLEYRATKVLEGSGTPYGDLTVVDRDNRIDISAEYALSEQVDLTTAGVTQLSSESVIRLRANASTESLESVQRLQYIPGYLAEVGIAIQIPTPPTGSQEVRWGYWNGSDGVYFGYDSTGVFVEEMRGGTRQGKVYRDAWNADPNIDAEQVLANGVISRLILALYNYGTIKFELFDRDPDDRSLVGKNLHNLSSDGDTTLSQQNLPLRVEVDNPASEDFDVFVTDRQATVRGQFTASKRIKGQERTDITLSGTTWVPILTIRRKSGFSSVNVGVFSIDLIASDPVYVQLRSDVGSEVGGDYAAPDNVSASETAIEVDTTPSGSIGDGFHRYQDLFQGGVGVQASLGEFEGVDLELKRERPFTVFARRTTGTGGTISAFNMNWEESW